MGSKPAELIKSSMLPVTESWSVPYNLTTRSAPVRPAADCWKPAVRVLKAFTHTGTAAEMRMRVDGLAAAGATEILYAPMGPDIPRELRMFIGFINYYRRGFTPHW